jgi:hypothetical protein
MTLEDQLRDVLADDRLALPPWPDATDRVRSGMRRRRTRRRAIVGIATTALVVLGLPVVVVGRLHHPAVFAPGFVVDPAPWPRNPSPYPATTGAQPTATDAHVCTAADFADHAASAGGGTPQVVITLTDRASTPCQLTDVPVLVTVDAARTAHTVPVDFSDTTNELPPPVAPGQSVQLVVTTSSDCAGAQPAVYDKLALAIGSTGRIPVPGLTLTSTCAVRVSAWHSAG